MGLGDIIGFMETDVEALVARAQMGDRDAYGEVYKLYFRKIFRFVYYSVEKRTLAEDITQDTFLRAWKALPSFSSERGTFQAFLFAIARNLVIDHSRKRREVALEFAENVFSGEDLEANLSEKQEGEMVRKSLSVLDSFEKELVIMRYFEELSYEEIANVTQKNAGAVRVRVHRALKKLREYLKEKGEI